MASLRTESKQEFAFDAEAAGAAAKRWSGRKRVHDEFNKASQAPEYLALDTPQRRAMRANRLMSKMPKNSPRQFAALANEIEGDTGLEVMSEGVSPEMASGFCPSRTMTAAG